MIGGILAFHKWNLLVLSGHIEQKKILKVFWFTFSLADTRLEQKLLTILIWLKTQNWLPAYYSMQYFVVIENIYTPLQRGLKPPSPTPLEIPVQCHTFL